MIVSTHREAAFYYQETARRAVQTRNHGLAHDAYLHCIQEYKLATLEFPSLKIPQQELLAEFKEFVHSDKRYRMIYPEVNKCLVKHKNVSDQDLSAEISRFGNTDLQYVLTLGEECGDILRIKKGGIIYFSSARARKRKGLSNILFRRFWRKQRRDIPVQSVGNGYKNRVYDALEYFLELSRDVRVLSTSPRSCSLKNREREGIAAMGSRRQVFGVFFGELYSRLTWFLSFVIPTREHRPLGK